MGDDIEVYYIMNATNKVSKPRKPRNHSLSTDLGDGINKQAAVITPT